MTSSEPPAEPLAPDRRQAGDASGGLDLLAAAARALAEAPAAADDERLVELLGRVVVPTLGDACALYAPDDAGVLRAVGVAPAGAEAARRLRRHLARHPEAAAAYAAVLEAGRPRIGPALGEVAAEQATGRPAPPGPGRAGGPAWEIAAPLGSGGHGDGVLVIGSLGRRRRPDAADLTTVELLAALVRDRRACRELARREAALRRRLEEATLAGRELAHLLNNDLTMPIGVVELLLDGTDLPAELHAMLEAASEDLAALERHVRTFHQLIRTQSGGPRSTARPDRAPPRDAGPAGSSGPADPLR
jgi:hypothetical protein